MLAARRCVGRYGKTTENLEQRKRVRYRRPAKETVRSINMVIYVCAKEETYSWHVHSESF